MENVEIKILNIKVNNKQTKAIELDSLHEWIRNKIISSNPILTDIDRSKTIKEFETMLYSSMIGELEQLCIQSTKDIHPSSKDTPTETIEAKPVEKKSEEVKKSEPKEVKSESETPNVSDVADEADDEADDEDDIVTLDD